VTLRIWVLVLASAFFAAGLGAGLLLALRLRPDPVPGRAFGDYERLFLERFELDAERRGVFRELLRTYERDLEDVRRKHLAAYRSSMEADLIKLSRDYGELVRDYVLVDGERAEFDLLAGGGAFPASTSD